MFFIPMVSPIEVKIKMKFVINFALFVRFFDLLNVSTKTNNVR